MRLIDADKAIIDYAKYGIDHPYDAYDLEDILNECPEIEAITKDQYEAMLKDYEELKMQLAETNKSEVEK